MDLLASKNAHKLAVIGAGAQARSHLAAIRCVRDITEVRVYDKYPQAAETYAKEMEEKFKIPVIPCEKRHLFVMRKEQGYILWEFIHFRS